MYYQDKELDVETQLTHPEGELHQVLYRFVNNLCFPDVLAPHEDPVALDEHRGGGRVRREGLLQVLEQVVLVRLVIDDGDHHCLMIVEVPRGNDSRNSLDLLDVADSEFFFPQQRHQDRRLGVGVDAGPRIPQGVACEKQGCARTGLEQLGLAGVLLGGRVEHKHIVGGHAFLLHPARGHPNAGSVPDAHASGGPRGQPLLVEQAAQLDDDLGRVCLASLVHCVRIRAHCHNGGAGGLYRKYAVADLVLFFSNLEVALGPVLERIDQLARAVQLLHVVASAVRFAQHQHVGHRAAASDAVQVGLELGAVLVEVQLDHVGLRTDRVLVEQDRLGLLGEAAVGLGEDHNRGVRPLVEDVVQIDRRIVRSVDVDLDEVLDQSLSGLGDSRSRSRRGFWTGALQEHDEHHQSSERVNKCANKFWARHC